MALLNEEARREAYEDLEALHNFVQEHGIEPIEQILQGNLDGEMTELSGNFLKAALAALIGVDGARFLLYCLSTPKTAPMILEELTNEQVEKTVSEIRRLMALYGKKCFKAINLAEFGCDCAYGYELFVAVDDEDNLKAIIISFDKIDGRVKVVVPPPLAARLAESILAKLEIFEKENFKFGKREEET